MLDRRLCKLSIDTLFTLFGLQMNKLEEEKREKSDKSEHFETLTFIKSSKVFFLVIFRFYTLKSFQRYQKRLKRSSDEKIMRETKLVDKTVGGSENFRYHSENFSTIEKFHIAKFSLCLRNFRYTNSEFFLINKMK